MDFLWFHLKFSLWYFLWLDWSDFYKMGVPAFGVLTCPGSWTISRSQEKTTSHNALYTAFPLHSVNYSTKKNTPCIVKIWGVKRIHKIKRSPDILYIYPVPGVIEYKKRHRLFSRCPFLCSIYSMQPIQWKWKQWY